MTKPCAVPPALKDKQTRIDGLFEKPLKEQEEKQNDKQQKGLGSLDRFPSLATVGDAGSEPSDSQIPKVDCIRSNNVVISIDDDWDDIDDFEITGKQKISFKPSTTVSETESVKTHKLPKTPKSFTSRLSRISAKGGAKKGRGELGTDIQVPNETLDCAGNPSVICLDPPFLNPWEHKDLPEEKAAGNPSRDQQKQPLQGKRLTC